MKCSLCGFLFEESSAASCCGSCPMNSNCKLIKCPRCGFETPPPPQWAETLVIFTKGYYRKCRNKAGAFFRRKLCEKEERRQEEEHTVNFLSLSNLKQGEEGEISNLSSQDRLMLRKMMAMGMFPGVTIKMEQRFPTYLLRVGESQVTIDENIAGLIQIRPFPQIK